LGWVAPSHSGRTGERVGVGEAKPHHDRHGGSTSTGTAAGGGLGGPVHRTAARTSTTAALRAPRVREVRPPWRLALRCLLAPVRGIGLGLVSSARSVRPRRTVVWYMDGHGRERCGASLLYLN
jgi:hypothetical protein